MSATEIVPQGDRSALLQHTSMIVAAQCSHPGTTPTDVTKLIQDVYATLSTLGQTPTVAPLPEPAVPIKKSVFNDHIVCLEDGRKLKMLKRHLMSTYGFTPEQYRARWGLAHDYPMVAPDYAQRRSVLAKKIGLGRKADTKMAAPTTAPTVKASAKKAAKASAKKAGTGKRGRPRKTPA